MTWFMQGNNNGVETLHPENHQEDYKMLQR